MDNKLLERITGQAVNRHAGDDERAITEMVRRAAQPVTVEDFAG